MTHEIESGVKIPKVVRHNFPEWPVGGSKFYDTLKEVESAQSAAYQYAKNSCPGFKTTRRRENNGYRLWRIA